MANSAHEPTYFRLEGSEILSTASTLRRRVEERFPDSGLSAVASEIEQVARVTHSRIEDMSRPFWPLRLLSVSLLGLTLLSLACGLVLGIDWGRIGGQVSFSEFIEVLEPTLGSSVFIGAFWVFSWSLENRWKQKRVLRALNELRSLIHVVD
ncbi:MAG: hypothetical protein VX498_07365, partial [Myxococcota bacterium]|nr:hypothetical protein [Myxococcota bacterium]